MDGAPHGHGSFRASRAAAVPPADSRSRGYPAPVGRCADRALVLRAGAARARPVRPADARGGGASFEGNRLLASGEGQTFKDSLGQQILPSFLSMRDDPRLARFAGRSLVGHYRYDDEGVEAQEARLVIAASSPAISPRARALRNVTAQTVTAAAPTINDRSAAWAFCSSKPKRVSAIAS